MKVSKKHQHESFESLMRRFKKGCEKNNTLLEVKTREQFDKPSLVRRKRREMAAKQEQKRQEDQQLKRFR